MRNIILNHYWTKELWSALGINSNRSQVITWPIVDWLPIRPWGISWYLNQNTNFFFTWNVLENAIPRCQPFFFRLQCVNSLTLNDAYISVCGNTKFRRKSLNFKLGMDILCQSYRTHFWSFSLNSTVLIIPYHMTGQVIIWTNTGLLLIDPLETNFNKIESKYTNFHARK